jgi:hypothetical protein
MATRFRKTSHGPRPLLVGVTAAALLAVGFAAGVVFALRFLAPPAGNTGLAADGPRTDTPLARQFRGVSEGVSPGRPESKAEVAPAPAARVPQEKPEVKPETAPEQQPPKAPEIRPDPPVRNVPKDPAERAVLGQADFEYLGAFALPQRACGRSTNFAETGLALRRVDGKLRVLTGSHRYAGDPIYEVEFPGWGTKQGAWPQAKIVREWGLEVFGNKRKSSNVGALWTHGLYYEEATSRLYFSFANAYNIPPVNDPSLGYAVLDPEGPQAFGPWKAPGDKAHTQKMRGGSLAIPGWFADRYLGGRTLGLGFGGYYSGVHPCSRGPFLAAAFPPQREGVDLDVVPLIDHPPGHEGIRDTDYRNDIEKALNPRGGVGHWTWMDEIFGGGTWIDLPDKHGMLFVATLGHGRVWYEKSDRHAERVEPWWFLYDPRDLAAVAQGKKRPWEPRPAFWKVSYPPIPASVNWKMTTPACTFDAPTRTVFVLVPQSYRGEVESYPLVHGWRVK